MFYAQNACAPPCQYVMRRHVPPYRRSVAVQRQQKGSGRALKAHTSIYMRGATMRRERHERARRRHDFAASYASVVLT